MHGRIRIPSFCLQLESNAIPLPSTPPNAITNLSWFLWIIPLFSSQNSNINEKNDLLKMSRNGTKIWFRSFLSCFCSFWPKKRSFRWLIFIQCPNFLIASICDWSIQHINWVLLPGGCRYLLIDEIKYGHSNLNSNSNQLLLMNL